MRIGGGGENLIGERNGEQTRKGGREWASLDSSATTIIKNRE